MGSLSLTSTQAIVEPSRCHIAENSSDLVNPGQGLANYVQGLNCKEKKYSIYMEVRNSCLMETTRLPLSVGGLHNANFIYFYKCCILGFNHRLHYMKAEINISCQNKL